ncbi:hypothetical protein MHSWG343_06010 [Candidatus Mycoplasma haematohominis]|uniref:Uncharacterized protein n=1 Tax=Candidatus Mycoplasma haematohominis TaxID=1494318 RepID=A0A478FRE7_9MOLU|nr:hypothetical protein MHSWG343_06010 [Candidatus Mycoplasma haemohominis]
MLKETKATIIISAISGNTALGIIGYELLKEYFLHLSSFEEITKADNSAIEIIKIERRLTKTVSFVIDSQKSFDPRIYTRNDLKTIDIEKEQKQAEHPLKGIKQDHKKLVVLFSDNSDWWNETYKKRKYIAESRDFERYVDLIGGYSNESNEYLINNVHMNQFCNKAYSDPSYFQEHEAQFWLMCTIDGKNPNDTEEEKVISQTTKAKFFKGEKEEEITYLTLEQSKKTNIKNNKIGNHKNKFVVYDYNEDWWKWSFDYRLKVDKENETSLFPLSNRFKQVKNGWDNTTRSTTGLNSVCKSFYEETDTKTQQEIDDAWRYCSDIGEETN